MTDRQYALAQGISQFVDANGYAPSIREIADMIDRSPTTTFKNLIAMQEVGLLDWVVGEPRTIHVTRYGRKQLATANRQTAAALGIARASRA